jgi:hypothetical protein
MATDAELMPQRFIVADERAAARFVGRNPRIDTEKGDAAFIADLLGAVTSFLRAAADTYRRIGDVITNPQLHELAFTNSVVIELRAGDGEEIQFDPDGRTSPTIDAARELSRLMAGETQDLVAKALELGTDATRAYRRLLALLAHDDAVLELQVPDDSRIVVITSPEAREDLTILNRKGELRRDVVKVAGTLTMADAQRHRFGLNLPKTKGPRPHPLIKRRVLGDYTPEVGDLLKKEGLWNFGVIATLEIEYDEPGSTAIPRAPRFRLIGAERATEGEPLF